MIKYKMRDEIDGTDIAIIGMAGRFPGAKNVEEYWSNLRDGVESVCFFTDEDLRSRGVDHDLLNDPGYVKAAAFLEGAELFDARFFGYTPREAEIMDPQHRIFLECAWQALENAGYCGETYEGSVGVFGGATINTYLLCNLLSNPAIVDSLDLTQINIANGADFLTTRVSYKLNLKGPSHVVQSACSTSLVAIHIACQNLLDEACDMALAGGVSVNVKFRSGYRYLEGGMASSDGHCRAFDAKAQGTVFGSGVGIVVLKRLADALEDKDTIHAIIKGSAINNDGSLKVGYTAPSVEGQARVIAEAIANSGIKAETISYIEAHGTGTPLGDPVEVEALTRAFRSGTQSKNFCALGSVKTNIGHLDAAAGVAGLIKTVLALKHRQLPPSLHFMEANPGIEFASSPFYVNAELKEWESRGEPRRAGVSSFGVGGTNAHVIVEEGPEPKAETEAETGAGGREWEVMVMSARTEEGLERATENLVEYLKRDERETMKDVSYTLRVGRKRFEQRRVVVCRDEREAIEALEAREGKRVYSVKSEAESASVVFMFPGQGTQRVNMCAGLYAREKAFREQVDSCSEILKPHLGLDIRRVLYPAAGEEQGAQMLLDETRNTQAALFVIEYSLAKLWERWGVRPEAMIGHSIGEYVAACIAGVISLEDALRLVAARGRLMQRVGGGRMIAVAAAEEEVTPYLKDQVWLAAVNGPGQVVLSGGEKAIEKVEAELKQLGIQSTSIRGSHAFHSGMMEEIAEEFEKEVRRATLNSPKLKYISNVTGRWATEDEVKDASYWVRHMREAVRFKEGVEELSKKEERVYLELGPGEVLGKLVKTRSDKRVVVEASIGKPGKDGAEEERLARALGRLWAEGVEIDWREYDKAESRRRVPLPAYPFERTRYWIEAKSNRLPDSVEQPLPVEGERDDSRQRAEAALPAYPRPDLQTPYVAPDNEIESIIAQILQRSLGIEKVGVYDNFFDLGGDSLTALQVIAELKKTFEREISVVSLYEVLTTKALAELLAGGQETEGAAGEEVKAGGEIRQEKMARRKLFQQKKRSGRREADSTGR